MPKRVTLKQVAASAGVSFQTVSKVLNGRGQVSRETEDRIWRAVRALHYQPDALARNLRTQRSRMIGYSWDPAPADQPNPILDRFLQSMMQAAERSGYHILPFPHGAPDPTTGYRELINTGRVDGFILSSVTFNDPRIAFLQEQAFPFVAFGRSNIEWEFPYVDVDGAAGICSATEHLIRRGHSRIAILAWNENSRVGQDRLDGYLQTIRSAGILPRPGWMARGDGCVEFGFAATGRWLDGPVEDRPTAVVGLNDALAVGAMHAARARGLQTGLDLAVTGFDDVPLAQYLTPPLTTVRQPIWEVGQHVVGILIGILTASLSEDCHVLLKPELIIRSSS